MRSIREEMRGKWTDALVQYGVEEKLLSGRHCSCPMCGGKDRFRYTDKDGDGRYFCNGCGAGDGMTLLQSVTGKTFKELVGELNPTRYSTVEKKVSDHSGMLQRLRGQMVKVTVGDDVCRYLEGRGIHRFDGRYLRLIPECYHWVEKRTMPAMVIALRDPDGDVLGFHLTFIEDGKKHSTLYTSGENGNAVGRLSDVTEYINIAEGAENAMSVSVLTGQACWAALDANRLEKFIPPAGTKGVNIYADVDHNHRGEIAAHKLAANLHSMGIAVKVIADLERGRDWNDRIQSLRD